MGRMHNQNTNLSEPNFVQGRSSERLVQGFHLFFILERNCQLSLSTISRLEVSLVGAHVQSFYLQDETHTENQHHDQSHEHEDINSCVNK